MAAVGMEMGLSGVGLAKDSLEDEACFQRGYGGCGFEPLGCVSRSWVPATATETWIAASR